MPTAGFIPGPGDSFESTPMGQFSKGISNFSALAGILRENQESKARIAQSAAETQDALARGQVAQQQAQLLGLQVADFRSAHADAHAKLQSELALQGAQTAGVQQQTTLAGMLAPGQLSMQQNQLDLHQAQQSEFEAQARHSNALADQEELHAQQLKQADGELRKNSDWLMKAYGFEGPAAKFNLNFVTAPIIQNLAKTQYESRLAAQHGDMLQALGDKARSWAQVQEDRIQNSGTNKNLMALAKLAQVNPAAASAYANDSDPLVAKVAQAMVANPVPTKGQNVTPGQVLGKYLSGIVNDPNSSPQQRMQALMWGAQVSGQKPDPIPDHFDMQTGQVTPAHYDWDGLATRMQSYWQGTQGDGAATIAPPTNAPASTQPSRVRMTDPQGRAVTVRADQIDDAKAQGYKER